MDDSVGNENPGTFRSGLERHARKGAETQESGGQKARTRTHSQPDDSYMRPPTHAHHFFENPVPVPFNVLFYIFHI